MPGEHTSSRAPEEGGRAAPARGGSPVRGRQPQRSGGGQLGASRSGAEAVSWAPAAAERRRSAGRQPQRSGGGQRLGLAELRFAPFLREKTISSCEWATTRCTAARKAG